MKQTNDYRHGYLLAQFISIRVNLREDTYGGSVANRISVVLSIIKGIRAATSKEFCIGIKLNSADVSSSGSTADVLAQIRLLAEIGIDFIEISGGSYEDPKMLELDSTNKQALESKKSSREAFFLDFARTVREEFPSVVLMVTGGFRTRRGMEDALASRSCDIIGIGRPATILPKLPKEILFNVEEVGDDEATLWLKPVKIGFVARHIPLKIVGAGMDSKYYGAQIQALGEGRKPVDCRM